VALKILRDREERFVEVTLGEQDGEDEPEPLAPGPAPVKDAGQKVGLGLSLQPLTEELAEAFGLPGETGVLVTAVEPDSPAAKGRPQGVARGDVIKEVARKPVKTLDDAKKALADAKAAKAKTVLLLVRNREGVRYILVDLPQ
jgi:serine protease Do